MMEYTKPRQGITVNIPVGMEASEVIKELRLMADDRESRGPLAEEEGGLSGQADKIGRAATKAPLPEGVEYHQSDSVNQMVLLYAILTELRKITPSKPEHSTLKTAVINAGLVAFESGPGSNLQRMARAYTAMKAADL